MKFCEDSEQVLPNGKKVIKLDDVSEREKEGDEKEGDDVSFTMDVLPDIIKLICILTMGIDTVNKDFLETLYVIKMDPTLLNVFQDQSLIWWKKDVIQFIEDIAERYIKADSYINSNISSIILQIKMSLENLIDKPKELLEFIDSCLKPKQKEKQENGEVFTPMNVVFEMLDQLDKHYILEHNGKSIFMEKEFKWFDPASGMGNFHVGVYMRLMEGLKEEIPDVEERKKHIVENMLYMSELIKKNVFICHRVFNQNGKYKMNLYQGDTLELELFTKFDVVIGNPPYNKGGIRSHTGKKLGDKNETIWTKFVEKSFEWLKPDGFLVFINPLSWLKRSHSLHTELLEKHIVWLKLWDNSQSKATINADIPISLYVLRNTRNKREFKTEITSILRRRSLTTTSIEYLDPYADSIPLAFHSIFNKLARFIKEKNVPLEYKTKTVKSCGTKEKMPSDYTLEDMWAVDTYTIKDGLMVKKATEVHPDANKCKLIISNKASFTGAFIDDGRISLTGNHKFYILGDNLEIVKKMLGFGIMNIIGNYTKYGQDFLDSEAFKYIPDIRKMGNKFLSLEEDQFYSMIGFTAEEISQFNK